MIYGLLGVVKIFTELEDKIENLYVEMGEPQEFEGGETRTSTTTGNYFDKYWQPGNIGDFNGKENAICNILNEDLDKLLSPLGLDGVSHYYTSRKWDDFVEQANDIITEDLDTYWIDYVEEALELLNC